MSDLDEREQQRQDILKAIEEQRRLADHHKRLLIIAERRAKESALATDILLQCERLRRMINAGALGPRRKGRIH